MFQIIEIINFLMINKIKKSFGLKIAKNTKKSINPWDIELMEKRCRKFERAGKYSSAIEIVQDLVELVPQDPRYYFIWGRLLLQLGENKGYALDKFIKAEALVSKFKAILLNIEGLPIKIHIDLFNRVDPYDILPNEIKSTIIKQLGPCERVELQLVSRRWNKYLANNPACWSSCHFSTVHAKGCTLEILQHFLKNADYTSNFKLTKKISLCLEKFASNETELECLKLLNRTTFTKNFKNLEVDVLILNITSEFTETFFDCLLPVESLEISKFYTKRLLLTDILSSKKDLATLIVKYKRLWPGPNLKMVLNISLRRLVIWTNRHLPTEFSIECLIACPNLEHFDFQYFGESELDLEQFSRVASCSKLKSLVLRSRKISRVRGMNRVETRRLGGYGGWPREMTSLSVIGSSWKDFDMVKCSLSKLQCLTLNRYIKIPEFLKYYDIGQNLIYLHIPDKSLLDESEIVTDMLQRSLNVRFLCITGLKFNNEIAKCILDHFPKLEEVDMDYGDFSRKALIELRQKKGLKKIGIYLVHIEQLPDIPEGGAVISKECVFPFIWNNF